MGTSTDIMKREGRPHWPTAIHQVDPNFKIQLGGTGNCGILSFEDQTLLINLQDELLFTIAYGEGLNTDLSDAYAPTGGWSYDTTPQTLVINEIALDSTRRDESRNIVRQRTNNCETSPVTANGVAINNVIYFVARDVLIRILMRSIKHSI